MPLEPPVIIVGDGQVEMFATLEAVSVSVEAIDASLYRAYDSKGRPVRISAAVTQSKGQLGITLVHNRAVLAELASDDASAVDELHASLLDWWRRTGGHGSKGHPVTEEEWTLAGLVAAIATRDGLK